MFDRLDREWMVIQIFSMDYSCYGLDQLALLFRL